MLNPFSRSTTSVANDKIANYTEWRSTAITPHATWLPKTGTAFVTWKFGKERPAVLEKEQNRCHFAFLSSGSANNCDTACSEPFSFKNDSNWRFSSNRDGNPASPAPWQMNRCTLRANKPASFFSSSEGTYGGK
eukprot:c13824_g1_i2.p1 GENE.c13824_g1_i2~~c13824_g1_i2.p1  ORF type:complete len:134 (+),score=21.72 c13824_g1_i2:107-508(+)